MPDGRAAPYAIVVVTWQCAAELVALVRSMNEQLVSDPHLIVVDNASDDDPEAALRAWRGPQTFVGLAENVGYGRANNVGVRAAGAGAVVLLNPDTELLDGGLDRLAAAALARRALVAPRLLNPDGSIQPSASARPVGAWPWIRALIPPRVAGAAFAARTEPWRLSRTTVVAWAIGACVAAPRDVLLALGPFDPAIELYGEDMDLGVRAAASGVPTVFAPGIAEVRHHGDVSAGRRYSEPEVRTLKAINGRAVLRRCFGARAETAAWRAERLRLALRIAARRALGRDAERDRLELSAASAARQVPALAAPAAVAGLAAADAPPRAARA